VSHLLSSRILDTFLPSLEPPPLSYPAPEHSPSGPSYRASALFQVQLSVVQIARRTVVRACTGIVVCIVVAGSVFVAVQLVYGPTGAPGDTVAPPVPYATQERCVVDDGSSHALPRSLLVEREFHPPRPADLPKRVVWLEELDGALPRRIERVFFDRPAEVVAPQNGFVDASDPRAVPSGGFRYVRWRSETVHELVTRQPDGRETVHQGGAVRPAVLGGWMRETEAPSTSDGRFQLTLEPEIGDNQPVDAIVRDHLRQIERARIPLGRVQDRPWLALRDDGGAFLVCVRVEQGLLLALHDVGRRQDTTLRANGACQAVSSDLQFVVLMDMDGNLTLRSFRWPERVTPLGRGFSAAFDRCGQSLVVARSNGNHYELTRIALGDLSRRAIAVVPDLIDSMEVTTDGFVIAVSEGEPSGGGRPGSASVVRMSGGELRTFDLPTRTTVVVHL